MVLLISIKLPKQTVIKNFWQGREYLPARSCLMRNQFQNPAAGPPNAEKLHNQENRKCSKTLLLSPRGSRHVVYSGLQRTGFGHRGGRDKRLFENAEP